MALQAIENGKDINKTLDIIQKVPNFTISETYTERKMFVDIKEDTNDPIIPQGQLVSPSLDTDYSSDEYLTAEEDVYEKEENADVKDETRRENTTDYIFNTPECAEKWDFLSSTNKETKLPRNTTKWKEDITINDVIDFLKKVRIRTKDECHTEYDTNNYVENKNQQEKLANSSNRAKIYSEGENNYIFQKDEHSTEKEIIHTSPGSSASTSIRPTSSLVDLRQGISEDYSIQTVNNNKIELVKHPQCINADDRLQTFKSWSFHIIQQPKTLVESGFYYTGKEDIVQCFLCGIGLAKWDTEDDPWVEHARYSPQCWYIKQIKGDEFIENIQTSLSQKNRARYEDYEDRVQSFKNWPSAVSQHPEQLAEAGFLYTGEDDRVRCHYCDGSLIQWKPGEKPWTEHARWFPFCEFVKKEKGHSFIDKVKRQYDNIIPSQSGVQNDVAPNAQQDLQKLSNKFPFKNDGTEYEATSDESSKRQSCQRRKRYSKKRSQQENKNMPVGQSRIRSKSAETVSSDAVARSVPVSTAQNRREHAGRNQHRNYHTQCRSDGESRYHKISEHNNPNDINASVNEMRTSDSDRNATERERLGQAPNQDPENALYDKCNIAEEAVNQPTFRRFRDIHNSNPNSVSATNSDVPHSFSGIQLRVYETNSSHMSSSDQERSLPTVPKEIQF